MEPTPSIGIDAKNLWLDRSRPRGEPTAIILLNRDKIVTTSDGITMPIN